MPKVSKLWLELQGDATTSKTLIGRWEFTDPGGLNPNKPRSGDWVKLAAGSKYYNGTKIPKDRIGKSYILNYIKGDKAYLNFGEISASSYEACAVKVADLTIVKSSWGNNTKNTLDYYEVKWYYAAGNGFWFIGQDAQKVYSIHHSLYNIPDNATKVKVSVKPVAKTYKSGKKDIPYWTGTKVDAVYIVANMPPEPLSAPTVTLENFNLSASVDNIGDGRCDQVQFEVLKGNAIFHSSVQNVVTARASITIPVAPGDKYRVRCRGINLASNSKVYGAWSDYSAEVASPPSAPTNLTATVNADSTVRLDWIGSTTATGYTIEYTTNAAYFDSSSNVSSINVTNTYGYVTSLEKGKTWYFRVRATANQLYSEWSTIVAAIIGTKPSPPTTWSLTTSAVIGETITLYWVHNSEDGSKQTQANIELIINGQASIITIDSATNENEKLDKVYSYVVDLSQYPTGAEILWRVRTRGITYEYSDWSVQRTIKVYAPPSATLTVGDGSGTLSTFPLMLNVRAYPDTQTGITYGVSIKALNTYRTNDYLGEEVIINAGTEVYSKVFTVLSNVFVYELLPDDLTLENGERYVVDVTVSMDSGLLADASSEFVVSWSDEAFEPDAIVYLDKDTYSACVLPYCINNENTHAANTTLAVYRREYDGNFTEVAKHIPNDGVTTVIDPHPALDYARYRIVARNEKTSTYTFNDIQGEPFGESAIIIQWDEKWSSFDYQPDPEEELDIPAKTGSVLRLPYNVDTNENYDRDKNLVKYIGRRHPVSYYGTQEGVSATWNVDVPKDDKETIYALRRLATWDGDVYVREPNGVGYSATINVSFNIKHKELKVPVTLDIVRVESDEA